MGTNVIEQLQAKAKTNPKKVVFPESEDKILKAARKVKDMGIGYPIVIGKPDAVAETAKNAGISLEGIGIIDHTNAETVDRMAADYLKFNQDYPASAVKRMLRDPLNFGAMMVKLGEADCMVAGLSHTTGEVIMAAQMIIGMKEGVSTVSSMGIASIPGYQGPQGDLLAIADCAVCPAPEPEELADIAITTADTIKSLLGWEPRVALLSFSTKGSASHEKVDKVLQALEIVHQRKPDLLIDGELQLDSAIVPEVAARKIKGESPVAGKANVLIFPDLNAGNIGVKLIQRFANAVAYGPVLQGFAKPVSDLSRGAPVEEIVGAAAIVVVRAQNNG
jgi:phosphate acetyltransferase